ncbi:MAG: PGPGW domain-containing protein, partial [Actinomycetota bacterium]|nr:PGPGW domain-containing protein [Actinomycetota bacterium]
MHMFKRFAVTIVGVALLALGAAMMVLPGPGILVIVGGLALLATEYVWARRMLKTAQAQAEKVQEAAVASPVRTVGTVLFGVALLALGLAMV